MNKGLESTVGIVVRGDISDINQALSIIRNGYDIDVVFTKASNGHLYITEEKPYNLN